MKCQWKHSLMEMTLQIFLNSTEWFVAIVTSLTQSFEEPANHFEWYTAEDCRAKA